MWISLLRALVSIWTLLFISLGIYSENKIYDFTNKFKSEIELIQKNIEDDNLEDDLREFVGDEWKRIEDSLKLDRKRKYKWQESLKWCSSLFLQTFVFGLVCFWGFLSWLY